MSKATLRSVLRDAWRLTRPFFSSEERWAARGLLVAIIAMNLCSVGITVLLNFWRGDFYNALQQKNAGDFTQLILFWRWNDDGFMPGFVPIVCVAIPLSIYAVYLTQLLQIRWRTWMTKRLLGSWLSDRAYYTISLQQSAAPVDSIEAGNGVGRADNPDQRIADDVRSFTADTLTIGLDLLSTVVSLVSFAQILWTLSGVVTVAGVTIPGYMLFIAILYALVGTGLTHLVGRPLALIEFLRQKLEADFRFALVRVRENTEGVALYAGEGAELRGLLSRYTGVVLNWRQYMNRKKKLNALTTAYAQIAGIFPIVIAAPRYFAGAIELGGLMRVAGAFAQVNSSLSWFIDSYPSLAVWRATVGRLTGFHTALETAHALAGGGVGLAAGPAGSGITLQDTSILLPDGRALMRDGRITLPPGRSTAITGRSGSGKSTLFRVLAGIWPFGSGTVERAPGTHLFLPQRPYIPLGTLRQAVCYPAEATEVPDEAVRAALDDAGLGALAAELDSDQPWAQRLSGGEQQRLAIARALLVRPDWLYLDEATASLDPQAEAELYLMLRTRLPHTTVLSIAHRTDVAGMHDAVLRLQDGRLVPA